jgi:hypothetical protein
MPDLVSCYLKVYEYYISASKTEANTQYTYIHTYILSFTDPLSVKTGLDIELVMIEAGLRYAVKSMQYNTVVVKIKKNTINNRYCAQAYNR